MPLEARGHREQVAQRHPLLPRVDVLHLASVEEAQDRRVERRELVARRGDPDHDRRHRLRHRLHRMQIAAPVIGVPPRVEVVVRPAGVERVQPARLLRLLAVDRLVVVPVRALVRHPPVPDHEHAVHEAVIASGEIGVECRQYLRVEPYLGRRRRVPVAGRLRLLCGHRRHGPERGREQQGRKGIPETHEHLLLVAVVTRLADCGYAPNRPAKLPGWQTPSPRHRTRNPRSAEVFNQNQVSADSVQLRVDRRATVG